MALKTIIKKVLNYSEIPKKLHKDIDENININKYKKGDFIEVHLDENKPFNKLYKWFYKKYPKLFDEESFFIEIDN
jgi:cupin superfamily acireductone dioxygenase involved in methionine salvage